jgi:membrane protease YdiL (CAAX protease family)
VLSSVLFGLFHGLHTSLVDLAEIMIGGLLLGLLRLVTGTLWLAIGFHAAWDFIENGIVTTRLVPAKGPMLEQTASGWAIPILLAAVLLLILIRRRDGRLSWRDRISESGALPLAAVGS